MNAVKKDYVVLVGGGMGRRWLAHDSLEDDGEPSTQPPTTTDPEMAYRTTSHSEVQKVLKATVRRYPTNEFRVDVLDTQVEARVEALPRLQQQAGAAYTLYQVASKALQDASGDAHAVNWGQVHQDVFAKAVGQDKQPVATVLEAIKLHSPGAVTPEQIAEVGALGESRELIGEDLGDCLRRIISEATALAAVGNKFTKPYAKSIEALATRAYDLQSAAKNGLVPNAVERQLDQRDSGPSGP